MARANSRGSPMRDRGDNGHLGRDRLVLAAADLADREGWLGLNLSRVAKDVDRHVTSLYSHVDGLEGLRREVILLALEELGQTLWQAALGRSGADAMMSLARAYRTYALDHPGRHEALATCRPRPEDIEMLTRSRHMAEPVFATLRSLGLDEHQVIHAHRIFFGTLRGFTLTETSGMFRNTESVDETFQQLMLLFVDALSSGGWPHLESSVASA